MSRPTVRHVAALDLRGRRAAPKQQVGRERDRFGVVAHGALPPAWLVSYSRLALSRYAVGKVRHVVVISSRATTAPLAATSASTLGFAFVVVL